MRGPMQPEEQSRRLRQLDELTARLTLQLGTLGERLEAEREERRRHVDGLLDRIESIEACMAEPVADEDDGRIKAPPSESGRWRVELRVAPECIGQAPGWSLVTETDSAEEAELWANMGQERRIVAVPLVEGN